MQIEFLGTGGAITTPRPGCVCRICVEAREGGVPYTRSGPSLFVHGPDVLIDTPEEIKDQLNRSRVHQIRAGLYSHWHPDHTMGVRVWDMNHDWRSWPPQDKRTDLYLPQQVAEDFRKSLGLWDHLAFLEELGVVHVIVLKDGDTIQLGETTIRPFRLAEDYVYAFLFETEGKRLLAVMDELKDWKPETELTGVDLAVLPMGVVEFDPFTGERRIPAEHPVLKSEATFEETLEIARQLNAERVILSHIEEPDGLSYDDLKRLERKLKRERGSQLPVSFAYDTLRLDI